MMTFEIAIIETGIGVDCFWVFIFLNFLLFCWFCLEDDVSCEFHSLYFNIKNVILLYQSPYQTFPRFPFHPEDALVTTLGLAFTKRKLPVREIVCL